MSGVATHRSAGYSAPAIRDYGDLVALTAADFLGVHAPPIAQVSVPGGQIGVLGQPPTTGGPSAGPTTPGPTTTLGPQVASNAGHGALTSASPTAPTGSGTQQLPFTGFPALVAGVVGSGFAAAGMALRKLSRKH